MASAEDSASKLTPAYVSLKTFRNFINDLRESGVENLPQQIDRSVLRGMSGSNQAMLQGALRFLGLTDTQNRPTSMLKTMLSSTGEDSKKLNGEIFDRSYSFLSDLNLKSATGAQVEAKFREQGVNGDTLSKAMSFFIAFSADAGREISKHVRAPERVKSNGLKKPRKKTDQSEDQVEEDEKPLIENETPPRKSWHQQLLEKFPAFDPNWDDATQKKWFDAFSKLMEKDSE